MSKKSFVYSSTFYRYKNKYLKPKNVQEMEIESLTQEEENYQSSSASLHQNERVCDRDIEEFDSIEPEPDPNLMEGGNVADILLADTPPNFGGSDNEDDSIEPDPNLMEGGNVADVLLSDTLHDFEESDIEDDFHTVEHELEFSEKLKAWAIEGQIKHTTLNNLLRLLKPNGHEYLPIDSRTLLSTPRKIELKEMGTGSFWYAGIESCLVRTFANR